MKKPLTIAFLKKSAREFCEQESGKYSKELFGITDGKAVGTYVEHLFRKYLSSRYSFGDGNSANGLDIPSVNTDIKVTSIRLPQSSCPFRDSKQKIYGLGYNLLVFVYEKVDNQRTKQGALYFVSCTFIDKERTADFQTTEGLRDLIKNGANEDDVFAFLEDHKIPGDEVTLFNMAKEILKNPPAVGYITISNALQWRLQYSRIVKLDKTVSGIDQIIRYDGD